jgi:hypothetical protein
MLALTLASIEWVATCLIICASPNSYNNIRKGDITKVTPLGGAHQPASGKISATDNLSIYDAILPCRPLAAGARSTVSRDDLAAQYLIHRNHVDQSEAAVQN